ncbi:sensor histidine kinase [Amycolatopsis taiwanensis]|uniref:sensor histidine kinase n=1 Tax=Amycolatopsis taiwanensis TaxID=342230 RepID=UPI0012EB8804
MCDLIPSEWVFPRSVLPCASVCRLVKRWYVNANPLFLDTALAVVATAITLGWAVSSDPHFDGLRQLDGLGVALTCLVNLPLAVRRRAPIAVLVVSCLAANVYFTLGYPAALNQVMILLAMYTVAMHRPPLWSVPSAAFTAGVFAYAQLISQLGPAWLTVAQSVVLMAVVWLLGNSSRRLIATNVLLAQLTTQQKREQEHRAHRAVTEERLRIARELHDVVAHHMSVISVQAGVARYVFESDPATASAAVDTIAGTSREALEEMRRLLAVLRIPPDRPEDALDAYDPAPGLDRMGDLLDRVRVAGVPVDLEVNGEARPLAPGVELCVYRVVQESLTNVLKYAQDSRATVELTYRRDELRVRVVNDGPPVSHDDRTNTGQGLAGMRERARLYGGRLTAGPRPEGGFEVVLVVPAVAAAGATKEGQ